MKYVVYLHLILAETELFLCVKTWYIYYTTSAESGVTKKRAEVWHLLKMLFLQH